MGQEGWDAHRETTFVGDLGFSEETWSSWDNDGSQSTDGHQLTSDEQSLPTGTQPKVQVYGSKVTDAEGTSLAGQPIPLEIIANE